VSVRSNRVGVGRARLGAPVVSINPSGAYLRHRAAVERSQRAGRRARWRCRLLVVVACALMYVGIGREAVQLARAKKDAMAMEARANLHQVDKDVERIAQASRLHGAGESISPVAFTSAAALARSADPSDVDAWLSEEPAEADSRLQ